MNHQQDTAEYRSGVQVVGPETSNQERIERARRGLSSVDRRGLEIAGGPDNRVVSLNGEAIGRYGRSVGVAWSWGSMDPKGEGPRGYASSEQECIDQIESHFGPAGHIDPSWQSYDPRQDAPVEVPKKAEPISYKLSMIIELAAAHEGGVLGHPVHINRGLDVWGNDVALLAWEWMTDADGWNEVTHEVFRHLYVRGKTWDQWPQNHTAKVSIVTEQVACRISDRAPITADRQVWEAVPVIKRKFAHIAWREFEEGLRWQFENVPFDPRPQVAALV